MNILRSHLTKFRKIQDGREQIYFQLNGTCNVCTITRGINTMEKSLLNLECKQLNPVETLIIFILFIIRSVISKLFFRKKKEHQGLCPLNFTGFIIIIFCNLQAVYHSRVSSKGYHCPGINGCWQFSRKNDLNLKVYGLCLKIDGFLLTVKSYSFCQPLLDSFTNLSLAIGCYLSFFLKPNFFLSVNICISRGSAGQ